MLHYWGGGGSNRQDDDAGWWFGTHIGGSEVWAFHDEDSLEPPRRGWLCLDMSDEFELVIEPQDIATARNPGCARATRGEDAPDRGGSGNVGSARESHREQRSRSPPHLQPVEAARSPRPPVEVACLAEGCQRTALMAAQPKVRPQQRRPKCAPPLPHFGGSR